MPPHDTPAPDPAGLSSEADTITVPIQRLPHGRGLPLPAYQTEHAAGMDLHAAVPGPGEGEPVVIPPGDCVLIPCGIAIAVPVGYEAQVRPRSGLAARHRVGMPNSPGTIDADYRGEVKVPLINWGDEPFRVERGMRIAQIIVKPLPRTRWREVPADASLPPTPRGEGGFGHTGHHVNP